jgi:hypothetical protein
MSSLPSISHRLFVAAVGHQAQARPRRMRERSDSEGQPGAMNPPADPAIPTGEDALAPSAEEMNVSALMSET